MSPFLLALAVWTVEQVMNIRVPSEPRLSPDKSHFAYVLDGSVHLQAIASGPGRRLAHGSRPRWAPDSQSVAWLDGGKIRVGGIRPGAGAKVRPAPGPVTLFEWMPTGDGFAAVIPGVGAAIDPEVADQNYRYARLWLLPGAGKARAISSPNRHVVSFAVSPDGKRAVYAAQPTPRNRDAFHVDLYLVELVTGAERTLVEQPGRDADPSFSPDGKLIAFHSQAGSLNYFGARHVGVTPVDAGAVRYVTETSGLDVFRGGNAFAWSPDSRTLIYTAGQGTRDVLVRHELDSGQETILVKDVSGTASFGTDAETAVFLKTSPERPAEVFLLERGVERQLTRLHDALARMFKPKGEVVRWKSTDGVEVEGVLWLPPGWSPGRRIPLLTELHGGPTGVALHAYPVPRIYPIQLFLDAGIGVFLPNFRGSSNYGAPFRLLNTLAQGAGDYGDVMTGIDRLVERGVADPARLGVMGWSYGGYLTGAVITQTHRFKAASIGAPATDWITYYGQSDGPREVLWTYFGGAPWDVPRNYERHSTRSRLGDIRTPTLLQVGALDINHNGEIYQALTDRKVPVEYVVYPREGHAIREPAHVRDALERNYRWFVRWLKP